MKPFLRLASVLTIATSALLVAACDNKAPEQTEAATAPAEGASAAAAGPFDVNSVALSTASLGDFPYLRLPEGYNCLLYTSPSPRDLSTSRMPSSA